MSSSFILTKLSPEIQSRDRLLYLYSSSNATTEDVQKFWSKQICSFCKQLKKSFNFSIYEIVDAYTLHGVRPTYVNNTVTELLKIKGDQATITDIRTFERNKAENTNVAELTNLFFSLSYVTQLVVPQSTPVDKKYVSCMLLREVQDILQRFVETLDERECVMLVDSTNTFSFSHLIRSFQYQSSENDSVLCDFIRNLSPDDQGILLEFMTANNSVIFSEDKRILKILKKKMILKPSSGGLLDYLFVSPPRVKTSSITPVEVAKLELNVSIYTLNARIEELERKAQDSYLKASAYKRNGNSNAALCQLSLRRQALQTRDKILRAVHDLTDASERIDDASINVIITEAYRAAASGLRAGREQAGLTPETVEEAVDLFRQEMDEMQSVSTAIEEASSTIAPLTAEQEQELDEELAALLATATAEDTANTSSSYTIPLFTGSVTMPPPPGRDTLPGEEKTNNDKKKSVLVVS